MHTAVLEHGANPGLISHFTKQALLDIAQQALADKKFNGAQAEQTAHHARAQELNHLAHHLGVKVIHCSERDTQISNQPKQVSEFVNTWSVEGFREEGTTTAEMGWGTHEKQLPAFAFQHADGPGRQICLARVGMNTFVASWVPPDHHIVGMVVRHGEAFSITEKLTVNDGVYHTYSGVICDHCQYHLQSFRAGPTQLCSVFGPTCDALDTISLAEQLPDMDLGELVYAENMGAYCAASSTFFNGFPPARVVHMHQ
jgi:homospermidine synthase